MHECASKNNWWKTVREWLGFSESLSARGTLLQNEGRQVHRGCSWEAACTVVVARYSDVLFPLLFLRFALPAPLHTPLAMLRSSPWSIPTLSIRQGQTGETKRQGPGKYRMPLDFQPNWPWTVQMSSIPWISRRGCAQISISLVNGRVLLCRCGSLKWNLSVFADVGGWLKW